MRHLRPALLLLASLSLLTGLVYPLAVTGIAQLVFPHRANGSLIEVNGTVVGSELIGQPFASDRHFWSRPSATSPPYNAASSAGSNLGPTNPALYERVRADIERLRKFDPAASAAPPVDLVTASGSGLDPDISLAAAAYQVERVARARGLTSDAVRRLVAEHTSGRTFGILGEPRVNVLELNLALERLPAAPPATTHPPA